MIQKKKKKKKEKGTKTAIRRLLYTPGD